MEWTMEKIYSFAEEYSCLAEAAAAGEYGSSWTHPNFSECIRIETIRERYAEVIVYLFSDGSILRYRKVFCGNEGIHLVWRKG